MARSRDLMKSEGCINQTMYKIILEKNLRPSALKMFPNSEDWVLQQDNVLCQKARLIKAWMEEQKTLPCESPDLNLKNLWNVIKVKIDGYKPSNKGKRTQEHRERLVNSMPKHMKVHVSHSTKY